MFANVELQRGARKLAARLVGVSKDLASEQALIDLI